MMDVWYTGMVRVRCSYCPHLSVKYMDVVNASPFPLPRPPPAWKLLFCLFVLRTRGCAVYFDFVLFGHCWVFDFLLYVFLHIIPCTSCIHTRIWYDIQDGIQYVRSEFREERIVRVECQWFPICLTYFAHEAGECMSHIVGVITSSAITWSLSGMS